MTKLRNNPSVSVIIPTYNRAHLIGRAIQSVLNQTYQDFEIIVVDDGSMDNTNEIIKDFQIQDKRIRYIKHEKNKGGAVARNTGIKDAKGEYISFLDSDDEWLKNKLESEIDVLKNKKNCIICSTGCNFIKEKGRKIISKRHIKKQIISQKIALRAECLTTNDFTVLKKAVLEIGGFDERLPARQDWDFWIRITSVGSGFQIPINTVNKYVMRNDQISSGIKNKLHGTEIIFKKHKKLFLSDSIAYERILSTLGLMHLLNNEKNKAIVNLQKSYNYTKKRIKKVKLAVILSIIKIFGSIGLKIFIFYYKFKNTNDYLLW